MLSALLLLAVHTLLAFARLPMSATSDPLAASRIAAERLAARAASLSGGLKLAAVAAAAAPSDPVGAALRYGAPEVHAAALAEGGRLWALVGDPAAGTGLRQAALVHAQEARAWFGLPAARAGAWLFAGAPLADGRQLILAAPMSDLVSPQPGDGRQMLVTAQGLVLATSAPTPLRVEAALGLRADQLQAAAASGTILRGALRPGLPVQVALARTPGTTLVAVVAKPNSMLVAGRGRALATNVFALATPLAIGLLLTLVLMIQTRKAEAAQRARRDSEKKFRLAVEAARCGIWEWDLSADRVSMSDVTGVMLGWGGGGLAAGPDVIARIAPEHRARVRQALRGAAEFGALDVSFCVPRAAGGVSWIDARGQAFGVEATAATAADKPAYSRVIGVALDVTDERTAEHRAQSAERRLHDAIDSVSEAFVLWDRYGR